MNGAAAPRAVASSITDRWMPIRGNSGPVPGKSPGAHRVRFYIHMPHFLDGDFRTSTAARKTSGGCGAAIGVSAEGQCVPSYSFGQACVSNPLASIAQEGIK